jgi:GTPase SAR1 family protein
MTNGCEISTKSVQLTPANSAVVKKLYATEKAAQDPLVSSNSRKNNIISDYSIDLFCYDLGGQPIFGPSQAGFLSSSNVCFFCFDITNRASFQSIPAQFASLQQESKTLFSKKLSTASMRSAESLSDFSFAPILVLIGLKSDLDGCRAVEMVEAEQFCRKNNFYRYVEWNCKSAEKNEQIEKLFFELCEKFVVKYENLRKIITNQLE